MTIYSGCLPVPEYEPEAGIYMDPSNIFAYFDGHMRLENWCCVAKSGCCGHEEKKNVKWDNGSVADGTFGGSC